MKIKKPEFVKLNKHNLGLVAMAGVIYVFCVFALFGITVIPVCETCGWSNSIYEMLTDSVGITITSSSILLIYLTPFVAMVAGNYIGKKVDRSE